MAQANRALKLLEQLPKDVTLDELSGLEVQLREMRKRILKAQDEIRKSAYQLTLTVKYPGLQALLDSGRAKLGEPKTRGLYSPTNFRLPAGLTSQHLLDLDRGER